MLPVAVFALLGQEAFRNSTGSTVGVQLQVLKAGNGPILRTTALLTTAASSVNAALFISAFFSQDGHKNNGAKSLHMPRQYENVHANPDSDCYMLQVTTLNFIFTPVVMGMTLTLVSLFRRIFRRVIQHHCVCF